MTDFTREINRMMVGFIVAFSVILLAATYYALVGGITLLPREDNPRLVEAEQSIVRGSIYDRNGALLARTTSDADGFAVREYFHPTTYSALGYYSYRYGVAGVEAAFDQTLRGADLPPTLEQVMLHQPTRGSDIRLTLDLTVQQRVANAMTPHAGAALVTTVPGGEVLALVSLPTYDPNTLDNDWETLVASPGKPFFNRALQGGYQPGTVLQLPIMADAITRGQPLNSQFPSGGAPVQLDDLTLSCVTRPPQLRLTLSDAFVYGCPGAFAQIAATLNPDKLQTAFTNYRLNAPPTLPEFFPVAEEAQQTPAPRPVALPDNLTEQANILGQGELNLSPIAVNALTAAVANGGNTPPPHIIQAMRPPNAETWTAMRQHRTSTPYMTAQAARQLNTLLKTSSTDGTASVIAWEEQDVYALAGIAYSGEGMLVWFTGYARYSGGRAVIVTVVLEDTDDTQTAALVGKEAFQAARAVLAVTPTPAPTTAPGS
jgi:penicillin-binding protein A